MGVLAKYPIALAPGMGLNAFFAYTVILTYGIPWQTALTGVLFSGVIFVLLTLTGVRETIINAIPAELKYAVGAGIGLYITFIGLQNAEIIVGNPETMVGIGDLTNPSTLLAIFGLDAVLIWRALNRTAVVEHACAILTVLVVCTLNIGAGVSCTRTFEARLTRHTVDIGTRVGYAAA